MKKLVLLLLFAVLPCGLRAQNLCAGTPTADVPVDVTSAISAVAPGVKVYQLTGLDASGNPITDASGKVISNYLTNVDVQNYTALNPPSFIVNTSAAVKVKTIRADHTGAQIAGTLYGLHLRVSLDGYMVAQAGMRAQDHSGPPGAADIFVTNLAADGNCQSQWVTNQQFTPAVGGGASGIPLTQPVLFSAGKYLIAYAPGGGNGALPPVVYSVLSDGSASPYTNVFEPADNCARFLYHKTRLDYRFPWLVFLQREDGVGSGSTQCGDIMDLRTGATVEYGDGTGGINPANWEIYYNHDNQASDGQHWIMNASRATGGMAYTQLLDDAGNFIPNSNRPAMLPNGVLNAAGYTILNPPTAPRHRVQAEWCDVWLGFAFCTSGSGNSTGGSGFPVTLPLGCYPAYAIDLTTLDVTFLTCTDGAVTGAYEGLPAIRHAYINDVDGTMHALFRSDKSGTPQVYEVIFGL